MVVLNERSSVAALYRDILEAEKWETKATRAITLPKIYLNCRSTVSTLAARVVALLPAGQLFPVISARSSGWSFSLERLSSSVANTAASSTLAVVIVLRPLLKNWTRSPENHEPRFIFTIRTSTIRWNLHPIGPGISFSLFFSLAYVALFHECHEHLTQILKFHQRPTKRMGWLCTRVRKTLVISRVW